jgi:hypothetical protein
MLTHSKQRRAHVRCSRKIDSTTDSQSLATQESPSEYFGLSDRQGLDAKEPERQHRRNPEDANMASAPEGEQEIGESSSTCVNEAARKTDSAIGHSRVAWAQSCSETAANFIGQVVRGGGMD